MYEQFLVFTYILGAVILEQVSMRQTKRIYYLQIEVTVALRNLWFRLLRMLRYGLWSSQCKLITGFSSEQCIMYNNLISYCFFII